MGDHNGALPRIPSEPLDRRPGRCYTDTTKEVPMPEFLTSAPLFILESEPVPLYLLGLGIPAGTAAMDPDAPSHSGGPGAGRLFTEAASTLLRGAHVLIGGKAQLAALAEHPAEKLAVGADMEGLFAAIAANRAAGKVQVVLCSGDPLYFGLGARLVERFGPSGLRILPGVSSLQAACALLGQIWEHVRSVSLHGRGSWLPLAHALLAGGPVFLLTDAASGPRRVARFAAERGYGHCRLHVLENLFLDPQTGLPQAERASSLTVEEALQRPEDASAVQRVILLLPGEATVPHEGRATDASFSEDITGPHCRGMFGLPDEGFLRENNLLTKSPVRAAGLAALGIAPEQVVWDLGAGSGAVGIEACRLAHRGLVVAVEKNPSRAAHIRENRRRFGAANLVVVETALPDCLRPGTGRVQVSSAPAAADMPLHSLHDGEEGCFPPSVPLPRPHRIFLGGGLGGGTGVASGAPSGSMPDTPGEDAALETLRLAYGLLLPQGRLVAHCVLLSTLERTRAALAALGATVSVTCLQAAESSPLGGDVRLVGMNPVFLIRADKP